MHRAMTVIASLVAILATPIGTLAQDTAGGTPAATPVATPVARATNAFEIGPEAGADPATTAQGYFVYELAAGDEATGSVRLLNPGR